MSWSPEEVETIIEEMRAGAGVMTGGSRCHTSYYVRDGEWLREDFDEGHTEEHPCSEARIRAMIVEDPELFRGVLATPRWRRFCAAYLADDPSARALLSSALEYGDRFDEGKLLDATLAGPETPPSPETVALIRTMVLGFTAYHAFMGAVRYADSPEVARKGVAFVDRLRELVGEAPGIHSLRASFCERAGDLAAAVTEFELELERSAADDWRRPGYEQSLTRLRGLVAGVG